MKIKLKYVTNNMKAYRIKKGLKQEEMALKLGISRATYCEYEVNPQKVKVEIFMKMADILNCKLADFFVENDVTISDYN